MVAQQRSAATLHDVAREAGVSLATASRVLNGSARKVAESYRERVEEAAARLGYTANLSAQATARGTSAIIALLVADIADPYFGQLAAGVARGADEAGLVVTIAITERDAEREARLVRALRGQRPQGLILAASRTEDEDGDGVRAELDAFAAMGGRVVALGPGGGDVRSVAVDNIGGARALGAALTGLGYRDAIILGARRGVRTSDDRIAGFTDGFLSGDGQVLHTLRGGFTREAGYSLMTEALKRGVEPGTVVFGVSDVVAIGALSAIRDAGPRTRHRHRGRRLRRHPDQPRRAPRPHHRARAPRGPRLPGAPRRDRPRLDGDAAPLPLDVHDPRQHPAAGLSRGARARSAHRTRARSTGRGGPRKSCGCRELLPSRGLRPAPQPGRGGRAGGAGGRGWRGGPDRRAGVRRIRRCARDQDHPPRIGLNPRTSPEPAHNSGGRRAEPGPPARHESAIHRTRWPTKSCGCRGLLSIGRARDPRRRVDTGLRRSPAPSRAA